MLVRHTKTSVTVVIDVDLVQIHIRLGHLGAVGAEGDGHDVVLVVGKAGGLVDLAESGEPIKGSVDQGRKVGHRVSGFWDRNTSWSLS